MIGAAWKARGGILLVLILWSTGMLTGSLHPVGVAAALVLLIASTWFVAALGTFASLVLRETSHATAWTMILLIVPTGTFFFSLFSSRPASVMMGVTSVPYVNFLCMVSYRDFTEAVTQGTFSYLSTMAIMTNEGAGRVLGLYLAAVAGYLGAAAWFTWAALRRFDRVAGRAARGARSRGRSAPKADNLRKLSSTHVTHEARGLNHSRKSGSAGVSTPDTRLFTIPHFVTLRDRPVGISLALERGSGIWHAGTDPPRPQREGDQYSVATTDRLGDRTSCSSLRKTSVSARAMTSRARQRKWSTGAITRTEPGSLRRPRIT
jgi:hypothetical protein